MTNDKYEMKLDLRVLDHLGIKLYSNVAAVLGELIANSWDADSRNVDITFEDEKITIKDDGCGMTAQQINTRFLLVGYDKRKKEGVKSPKYNRNFMGRKGIGKLAVFSVAKVLEIYSCKDGEKNALRIEVAELQKQIELGTSYHPKEIPFPPTQSTTGTMLVLTELVKKRLPATKKALQLRIARRFSVIGLPTQTNGSYFKVRIDGQEIGVNDRDDLKSLEYLWEFDKLKPIVPALVPNLADRFIFESNHIKDNPQWIVSGWIGSAKKPAVLENEDAGSLRNIVVMSRGRLIQENILDKLGFNGVFGSYVTGQIQADFLDDDASDDIATSDRQRLVEDDPRVGALVSFLRNCLLEASEKWSKVRKQKKADEAISEHPALGQWISSLPAAQRSPATSLIGLIEGIELDKKNEGDRKELFRSGVLAFERLRLKEASHQLANLDSLNPEQLLPLLETQDFYEAALYHDIVKSRVESIRKFQDLTDDNAKEKVLQQHLFDHLWLLDAGWERATGSETIEHRLKRDYPKEFADDLTQDEQLGRVDIKYRDNSGAHIIVELKRYKLVSNVDDLEKQGKKYRSALTKLLRQENPTKNANPMIHIVFVLGNKPKDPDEEGLPLTYVEAKLSGIGAWFVTYDELIQKSLAGYDEYLEKSKDSDLVDKILKQLT